MVMKQASNEPGEGFPDAKEIKLRLLKAKHRIELHIYTNEWVSLGHELLELGSFSPENLESIPGLATKLLIMVTTHVRTVATSWFDGMLTSTSSDVVTYMPCWKCYAEVEAPDPPFSGEFWNKRGGGGREERIVSRAASRNWS